MLYMLMACWYEDITSHVVDLVWPKNAGLATVCRPIYSSEMSNKNTASEIFFAALDALCFAD